MTKAQRLQSRFPTCLCHTHVSLVFGRTLIPTLALHFPDFEQPLSGSAGSSGPALFRVRPGAFFLPSPPKTAFLFNFLLLFLLLPLLLCSLAQNQKRESGSCPRNKEELLPGPKEGGRATPAGDVSPSLSRQGSWAKMADRAERRFGLKGNQLRKDKFSQQMTIMRSGRIRSDRIEESFFRHEQGLKILEKCKVKKFV